MVATAMTEMKNILLECSKQTHTQDVFFCVWQSVNHVAVDVQTPRALQSELSLRQGEGTMGKLTYRLITANELEQCSSSCFP